MSGSVSRYIVKFIKNTDNYYLSSAITEALLYGAGGFVKRLLSGLYSMALQLKVFFVDRIWGRNYFMFFFIFVVLIIMFTGIKKKKTDNRALRTGFMIIYFGLMIIAVALFFTGWAADRHLAEFVVMGIVFIAMEAGENPEEKNVRAVAILLEAALIFSVIMVPNRDREYVTDEFAAEVSEAKVILEEKMPLNLTDKPSWDNTVLWVYTDTVDSEEVIVPWRALYALPSGYGLNLVFKDTWFDEYDDLNSKYLAAASGSDTEKRCIEWGADKIIEYCGVVIYRLYK
ncbi:MAG: hypothetical protein K6E98_01180 [Lachnospiraceae bacterium]|nr:hypothetical protein [Lachnospiraceae bacterium]